MKRKFSKYLDVLFVDGWAIGVTRGNIQEIIRSKTFNPDITWLPTKSMNQFYADPFLYKTKEGTYDIIFEAFSLNEEYGKIAVMSIDNSFKQKNHKIVLDTKSHLSYPFIFKENNKIYVFPEAARSGKLSCYEYDPVNRSLKFLQQVIDLPILDGTILKHNGKYWLFGVLRGYDGVEQYKLCIFYSNSLLGPYTPHPMNPVKNSLNGTRSAGNFIEVDGEIYRPTQNCENSYGESITINKMTVLTEMDIQEEEHMSISINKEKKSNSGINRIHTINVIDDIIVVDGKRSRFSPMNILNEIAKKKEFTFGK